MISGSFVFNQVASFGLLTASNMRKPHMLRIAMISYHTCPLATLGGKDTGGMNVYVRELTRQLGKMGIHVDVFTRSQDDHVPYVLHELGYGNRVVHVPAGPEHPLTSSTAITGCLALPPHLFRTIGLVRPSYTCSTLWVR